MTEFILNVSSRLHIINTLLEDKKNYELFTIDDALLLASFFRDYSKTNRLIEEAELLAKNDIALLCTISTSILEESNIFMSLDLSMFNDINFDKLFEDYIKPFMNRYDLKLKEAALQVKDYNEKNNRYDMASELRDGKDVFFKIKNDFEISEKKYKDIQAEVKQLYKDLKNEENKYLCIYKFQFVFFRILIDRLKHISETILVDIHNIQKEESQYDN